MKLASSLGSFEISILGYGQQSTNWRKRNNLQCQVSTCWQTQKDTHTTPFQTYELSRLLLGLQALSSHKASHVTINFAEPGLSLEISAKPNQKYHFQIQLDYALTPSWNAYPGFPVEMEITLDHYQLQEVIQQLTLQLSAFPER